MNSLDYKIKILLDILVDIAEHENFEFEEEVDKENQVYTALINSYNLISKSMGLDEI